MSILRFTDSDGDVVAVESSAICAVRVGRVQGRPDPVTLVSVAGSLVAVVEPTEAVVAAWTSAQSDARRPAGTEQELIGWLSQWFNESALRPSVPAPWAPKPLQAQEADR